MVERLLHLDIGMKQGYPNTALFWVRFVKQKDPEAEFERVRVFAADREDAIDYWTNRKIHVYSEIPTTAALLIKPSERQTLLSLGRNTGSFWIIYKDFVETRKYGTDPYRSFTLGLGDEFQPQQLGISREEYKRRLQAQEDAEIDFYLTY